MLYDKYCPDNITQRKAGPFEMLATITVAIQKLHENYACSRTVTPMDTARTQTRDITAEEQVDKRKLQLIGHYIAVARVLRHEYSCCWDFFSWTKTLTFFGKLKPTPAMSPISSVYRLLIAKRVCVFGQPQAESQKHRSRNLESQKHRSRNIESQKHRSKMIDPETSIQKPRVSETSIQKHRVSETSIQND